MPQENENVFIAENQSLNVDEQKKNDILSVIESCNDLQDFIKRLEEENLIWYFIGPLRKDEDITGQINLKWEKEFQKFEQSINTMHKELKSSLPGQNFLAYSTKDNDFKIRFENEEKPIEISNILRASREGKVYNISLEKDSQITATKKGSERHYDFTGSSSCEMTINWQAKDSEGNSIDCSMIVKLDSSGIQSVIGEPKFGDLKFTPEEIKDKILKLVEQNKEVFINGKTLHQAFTDMSRSVDDQQVPAEEIFTKDPHISPQSPTPSSSGYSSPSTPSSRRSSFSSVSEFSDEDEILEDDMSSDEEEHEQEGAKGEVDEIEELEKEKETFAKYFAAQAKQLEDLRLERDFLRDEVNEQRQVISEKNQRIKEQGTLIESLMSKEQLKNQELVKELNQLYKEKEDLEMAIQQSGIGKKSLADEIEEVEKNEKIESLRKEIKQKDEKIQQIVRESQKLEGKLQDLRAKYSEVKNEDSEYIENLTRKLKQAEIEFIDNKDKLTEQIEKLAEEKENLFRQLRAKSTDSTSFRKQQSEIDKLKQQLKEKEGMLTCTQEELASVKESLEQLQNILQQEKGQATQTEVEYESRGTSMQQQDQGTQAVNNNSSRIASGLRQENKKLTRDKLTISEQLKQKIREIDELKKNLKQLQEENKQLKQEVTKNAGVDTPSSTGQKEAKEAEVIPQNIMDWPVPIPDDKPEEQKTPLEPIKVNTELSDPKSIPAEDPEKSPPLSKG
ncbi:hypothetical protein NMD99_06875 [Wolbachia endosymbiont of Listronotus oregonensis]|uniref:hypothetical protein n=2 Tax=Wolbachia TaxID=953 RepID=UPI00223062BD|nr:MULTISPECIES: hypothetical protein [unclassified Wolbachia]WMT84316.1 hypothetical protein NMD99_06875 [Wolbachia endosymbiont of Listronotus oregonensis]